MQIRRIDIENFRGVRELSWTVPRDRSLFVLIGPGDAMKSTVLTAIERGLSDRWNITFQDTDFYKGDIEKPIRIRVTVADLPDDLMALDAFGSCLCGIYPDGTLTHDAQDDNEPCVVVELRVNADLEPQWLAHRPGDSDADLQTVKASVRAEFGVFRIDERVDAHLRWSRMSALGKLTEKHHGTKQTLTVANRAARDAVDQAVSPELAALADDIQAKVQEIGSAEFGDLKPGLDMSLTNAQGNLALFDGPVPLMNFGLGTRRLAGAAVQQLANEGRALLLVDEVEYGLEPHRLVHLLGQLQRKDAYSQVYVTTHSPTALQHLKAADFVMVRSVDGETILRSLDDPASLQGVLRSTPEAFLSRRVVVGEGKTEYGLVLGLLADWNIQRIADGNAPSSALGVVAVEGKGGGTGAAKMTLDLLGVGYEVTLLIDGDDEAANKMVPAVVRAGGFAVQWDGEYCTEAAICAELDADGLADLVQLAIGVAEDPDTAARAYSDQLTSRGAPTIAAETDVSSWLSGLDLPTARAVVAKTAKEKAWFKNVARGMALAEFLLARDAFASGPVADALGQLWVGIYQERVAPKADAEQAPATGAAEQSTAGKPAGPPPEMVAEEPASDQ
ncbi:MAG: hypothetical protein QOG53_1522 [Frankiales bacterium]|jgi:hypothetical protein|nr:hypothetical protein [Frankiales bacterium]